MTDAHPRFSLRFCKSSQNIGEEDRSWPCGCGDWNDLCGNEFVDTRERDGLIFLDPGYEDTGQTPHFFIYLPLETAFTALNERATLAARIEPLIEAALTTAWGTLAVLAVGARCAGVSTPSKIVLSISEGRGAPLARVRG